MSLGRQSQVPDGGRHHLVVSVVPGHFGVAPIGNTTMWLDVSYIMFSLSKRSTPLSTSLPCSLYVTFAELPVLFFFFGVYHAVSCLWIGIIGKLIAGFLF